MCAGQTFHRKIVVCDASYAIIGTYSRDRQGIQPTHETPEVTDEVCLWKLNAEVQSLVIRSQDIMLLPVPRRSTLPSNDTRLVVNVLATVYYDRLLLLALEDWDKNDYALIGPLATRLEIGVTRLDNLKWQGGDWTTKIQRFLLLALAAYMKEGKRAASSRALKNGGYVDDVPVALENEHRVLRSIFDLDNPANPMSTFFYSM